MWQIVANLEFVTGFAIDLQTRKPNISPRVATLKNYMTPLRKINRRVPVEKTHIGFLNTIEIDADPYQISFNCDIKISHFAVLLMSYVF